MKLLWWEKREKVEDKVYPWYVGRVHYDLYQERILFSYIPLNKLIGLAFNLFAWLKKGSNIIESEKELIILITKKEYEAWQKGHERGKNEAIDAFKIIMFDQEPELKNRMIAKMKSLII